MRSRACASVSLVWCEGRPKSSHWSSDQETTSLRGSQRQTPVTRATSFPGEPPFWPSSARTSERRRRNSSMSCSFVLSSSRIVPPLQEDPCTVASERRRGKESAHRTALRAAHAVTHQRELSSRSFLLDSA